MENTVSKKKSLVNAFFYIAAFSFVFALGFRMGDTKNFLGFKLPGISTAYFQSTLPSPEVQEAANVNDRGVNFDLMWEAWSKFENKYVDRKKLDTQKMFYNSIKGVLASAEDPYTFFLTPEENKQSQDSLSGKFEGIGAQLGTKDGVITVIAPLKNSPALKKGVKAGDIIIRVDGVDVRNMPVAQVVTKIRGSAGTSVKITLLRGKEEITYDIIRAQIQQDIFEVTYEGKVAHVRMGQFGGNTISEWQDIAEDLNTRYDAGQISGIVLDVRDNPGGYFDAAVYMASEFLTYGDLVVRQATNDSSTDFRVTRNGTLQRIPVTVLINKGSASAAEILAGALRDHKRAKLIGEKSFGKGSVQEVIDLTGGSGMHVTVAKWILPHGDWIHGRGISPDIEVKNPESDASNTVDARKKDAQLNRAIELLR